MVFQLMDGINASENREGNILEGQTVSLPSGRENNFLFGGFQAKVITPP